MSAVLHLSNYFGEYVAVIDKSKTYENKFYVNKPELSCNLLPTSSFAA